MISPCHLILAAAVAVPQLMSNVVQPGDVPKAEQKPTGLPMAFRRHLHLLTEQLGGFSLEAWPSPPGRRPSARQALPVCSTAPVCERVSMNLGAGITRHLKDFHMELVVLIFALGVVATIFWVLSRDSQRASRGAVQASDSTQPPLLQDSATRVQGTSPD